MKWCLWIALALVAASCSAPQPPDEWSVQRVSPVDTDVSTETTVCSDVRTLALGSLADQASLGPTLAELARISAVVGATSALPKLNQIDALDPSELSEVEFAATRHDLLVEASAAIDDATWTACQLPAFTALYAATGFAGCHFEMEIAVGAYTVAGAPGECSARGRPTFLPCFSDEPGHLPVDCISGEIVHAVGERWEPAGEPHPVTIDRPAPDEPVGPPVISPTGSAECRNLVGLFRDVELPNGAIPDFDRLSAAAADLDPATAALIDDFIRANETIPSLAELEALVAELDERTADECGFPLVSAWASIHQPVDDLPCWTATGITYPAYEQAECP